MIVGVAILGLIYIPYIRVKLFPPVVDRSVIEGSSFSLSIPKIDAYSPIHANVDPWNAPEYREKLQTGVAHAKGTSLPGEGGSVYLFAHSSDVPWRITQYNTVFYRLSELEVDDMIFVKRNGEEYTYSVRESIEVWPNEIKYLTDAKRDQIVLQTCTPVGTAFRRLLVFADPI